ncbi:MAG: T3/T7 RNA polymerase [Comamonadaceae bacterium]|nr:T3/T7 RNA polymerase [Comamonadaceae bacterium]
MYLSPTARVEAQLELEALSVDMGIARYREALAREGTEALPPGMQLMKAAIGPMKAALEAWLEETSKGLAGRSASLFYFLNQADPEALAYLTARQAISAMGEDLGLTKAATALTLAIESTLNMEAVCNANPRLGAKVAKQISRMGHGKNIAVFIRKGAAMVDVKWIQWDEATRIRVGTLLLEMFAQATGLVTIESIPAARGKTPTVLRATESCRRWLEESHARCELLSPLRMPMVCRPRDWTNPFNGGYLTHQLRQPLVKTRNKGYLQELKEWDMPWVYAAVNAVQATEWAINMDILAVMRAMWERGDVTKSMPSREDRPMPHKPWNDGVEVPAPEVLHAWKVDAARTHESNAKLKSKRLQLVGKLWTAEQMVERGNRFHFVYALDWRGRMYPVAGGLSPQGDDAAKALLCFAQSSELSDEGAYWLAIHGANSFGVDKVSFEDRISWVEENQDMILRCAAEPLSATEWHTADSPFVFLAFCFEWARLQAHVDAGLPEAAFRSSIAVAFDGACNGLQNFSAMLRDPVGGAATGLVPSHKPSDIYTEVAQAAQRIIDRDAAAGSEQAARWVGKMSRKLAKRNTMTVPYGVTRRGMRDQLFGELAECAPEFRGADAAYLAACNYEAIGEVVVAARQAMDWLKEAAKVAASNALPVRWTTPAGLLVVQDYRNSVGTELDFVVLGRRYRLLVDREGDKLNARKQALGISPNFVHSLDAAHLMRTVLFCAADGITSFAMIHDSYGVPAGQAATLRDNLRAAFVEQYQANVLADFRQQLVDQLPEELAAQLPELPEVGDLDLEQVKQSEYFFA